MKTVKIYCASRSFLCAEEGNVNHIKCLEMAADDARAIASEKKNAKFIAESAVRM